jgi:hypothetical protein
MLGDLLVHRAFELRQDADHVYGVLPGAFLVLVGQQLRPKTLMQ